MQNQKNLIQATADFEHWRQTRINKHASIPDELRCLALKLLEEYPISHVTKALRICTTQLNDWRKQLPVKSSAPDFVPLQIEPDLLPKSDLSLQLTLPNSSQICISDLVSPDLLRALIQEAGEVK